MYGAWPTVTLADIMGSGSTEQNCQTDGDLPHIIIRLHLVIIIPSCPPVLQTLNHLLIFLKMKKTLLVSGGLAAT